MSTAAWLVIIALTFVVSLLILEGVRIAQRKELITTVVRRAYRAQPGVFILFSFIAGYIAGHFFWN